MRLAAGRRCFALLAARRPSWRCGGGTQGAWRLWQPLATYRGLATATWTTSCCTPQPARWCPSTSGAQGGDAVPSALLILLRFLVYTTGDMPCGEECALHHMPARLGAGRAAGGCVRCTAESWMPQCVLRQVAPWQVLLRHRRTGAAHPGVGSIQADAAAAWSAAAARCMRAARCAARAGPGCPARGTRRARGAAICLNMQICFCGAMLLASCSACALPQCKLQCAVHDRWRGASCKIVGCMRIKLMLSCWAFASTAELTHPLHHRVSWTLSCASRSRTGSGRRACCRACASPRLAALRHSLPALMRTLPTRCSHGPVLFTACISLRPFTWNKLGSLMPQGLLGMLIGSR
jgi:hypothetical protein